METQVVDIFWLFLACLAVGCMLTMGAVALGGYLVYRTKREDGRFFTKPQQIASDEPLFYTGEEDLEHDLTTTQVPDVIKERSNRFVKGLFNEKKVEGEK